MSDLKKFDQYGRSTPAMPGQSSCFSSVRKSGLALHPARPLSPVTDPLRFAAVNPDLWMQFLHATCRNIGEAAVKYGVTERAARKWWEGDGACRLDKVQIAMRVDRRAALDMLFPK